MAHNISNVNGINEVFVAGAPAWHNLGVNVSEAQTWEEAVKLAHLDWTVSKQQLKNPITDNLLDGQYALLRDDTHDFLSIVGNGYRPIQNVEIFDWCTALVENKEAKFASAGALNGGRTVWCLCELKNEFAVVKSDAHKTYLLAVDNRDKRSATLKVVDCRVVCNNTLSIALGEAGEFIKIRHSANADQKIFDLKALVAGVSANIRTLEDKLKELSKKKVTAKSFEAVLTKLFPELDTSTSQQKMAAQIAENFTRNDNNAVPAIQGTAYNLFNAFTEYADHNKTGFRGGPEVQIQKRAQYALFDDGVDWKNESLDTICDVFLDMNVPEKKVSVIDSILDQVQV